MLRRILSLVAVASMAVPSLAHHGRRFLLMTEFRMPHPGGIYLVSDYGALKIDGRWSQESSTGFLMAVGNQSMSAIEVHGHFAKEGAEPWLHEATGFEFRHRLNNSTGWNYTAGLEAEVPREGGKTGWTAQFIGGKESAKDVVAFNVLAENEEGLDGKTSWSYRAGWSPETAGRYGYSVEAAGGFDRHASHELLFGIATSIGESGEHGYTSLFKFGIGVGLTKDSPDFTIRAGIVLKM